VYKVYLIKGGKQETDKKQTNKKQVRQCQIEKKAK